MKVNLSDKPTIKGVIYYASKDAQHDRLVKEGETVTLRGYHSAYEIEPGFYEVNFKPSGTSYVHVVGEIGSMTPEQIKQLTKPGYGGDFEMTMEAEL